MYICTFQIQIQPRPIYIYVSTETDMAVPSYIYFQLKANVNFD
jgi:hypothetical protein